MIVVKTINFQYANYQIGYDLLSQDKATNTSRIKKYGVLNVTGNSVSWSRGTASVDGTTWGIGTNYSRGSYVLVYEEQTVYHNQNGEYTGYMSGSLNTSFYSGSGGDYFTLPKIDRIITVTNTVNFNDTENPTITFNNPVGYRGQPYLIFHPIGGGRLLELTREIGNYTSPYTFEITAEERVEMLQKMNTATKYTVYEGFYTYDNNDRNIGYSTIGKEFSIIDSDPSLTYTKQETNPKVINVLGTSANQSIKGISNLKFTVNPITQKYATVDSVNLKYDTITLTKKEAPYEFNITPTKRGIFTANITDSRKLNFDVAIDIPCLDYEPVSINSFNFERLNPTSSDIRLELNANYYQGKYGNTNNTPLIKWALNDGDIYEIDDYQIDTENKKITVNTILRNALNYKEQGTFKIVISDLFSEATDKQVVIKGIPLVELGEHEVQVNGDLLIADEEGENPVSIKDYTNWKLLGETIGTTKINLPTQYSEILCMVTDTTNKMNFSILIPKLFIDTIGNEENSFQSGYYQSGSYGGRANVHILNGQIWCASVYVNSTAVSNKTSFYYR